ncbi:ThiF family adenylyltransferase [Paraburkholderia kururiensis]|uniref:ThiF family adenylyltransferase n=1 Tax=Paraburkholderia kururiensis TaxID=984307 RepID=UPI0018F28FF5|nr:ThiF family adenylyltransferase [Paraburkholderia kururiensis]
MNSRKFFYDEAFSRNIGWITHHESRVLRTKRIAIAGMGGAGGSHLINLVRLGVGAFNIADFDRFELANFNRQVGARMSTLNQPKVSVMAEMALDINPELDIRIFKEGVLEEKIDSFLDGVDVYVDGVDFFVMDIRRKLYARCREKGIPVVIAFPAGMGAAFLVFSPDGMSFEDYFRMGKLPAIDNSFRFMFGLTPARLQFSYLADRSALKMEDQRIPSTGLACDLCGGAAAAQVLKLLLNRGPIYAAPWYQQFDLYRCRWVRGRLPFGNHGPLQRMKIWLAKRRPGTGD